MLVMYHGLRPPDDVIHTQDEAFALQRQDEVSVDLSSDSLSFQVYVERTLCSDWLFGPYHHGCNVLWVVSIQVKLECHHLVVVGLQLTLHHSVHLIRHLETPETRSHGYQF